MVALNFAAIVAFSFVIIFMELKVYLFLKAVISKSSLKKFAFFLIFLILAGYIFVQNVKPTLVEAINNSVTNQINLLFGERTYYDDKTFVGNFFRSFLDYPKNMLSFPPGILLGDGFSSWGVVAKGGDFGHVETLHRLGFPFYIAVIIGLFRLVKSSIKKIQIYSRQSHQKDNYLYFAVCIILYIFITTFHYSTWSVKSIFPIFMISIAIIGRHLYSKGYMNRKQKIYQL